ncbi:GDSL-type esterase/lipase family protein [Hydrogenophaga sp.]|uniref:SGNH/GDSL hydrolase family protein n=1 Tax=Hydrogenophaga sp. TaxID=1904254 RepID=UPI0026304E59|nr:GDSL-type esterase/lipase family protein [Hydrogenophaga sp.]MDM7951278.1 GDSL-type esterase/lipase family protein [Hydrogenophaga sp.]
MKTTLLFMSLVAAIAVLGLGGCAASRISQAAQLARESEPLQHRPANASMRLLIVGDSTGVGTGATSPQTSLAGLLAQAFPRLRIDNRARDGATFEGVVQQLQVDSARYDVVLIQAGGNDVIRLRSDDAVRADIDRATALAAARSDRVLLMPAGNVGNAPFFFPPLSSLMTTRAERLHGFIQAAAQRHGAVYINLFQAPEDDPFVQDPNLHARDGLHPSDAGYRLWFDELLRQADLAEVLAPARVE